MNNQLLTPDLARARRTDLRRGAARSRLVAVVQCCRPSWIKAAVAALRARPARSTQDLCCA